jgi:TPR repeat protein
METLLLSLHSFEPYNDRRQQDIAMTKHALLGFVLTLALSLPASAGPMEDAFAGMHKGCQTAQKYWRSLAERGDASAQFKLGMTYEFGGAYGCAPPDLFEAVNWYRKAANQNFRPAEEELASALYLGQGVGKDYREALKWWHRAADQGSANSKLFIGEAYWKGDGVPQDYVEAAKWIREAAASGDMQAQHEIGTMYEKGIGVSRDYVEAYMWLNLAVARWPANAPYRDIAVKDRDRMASKLTPAQLIEAQRRAVEWKPL